MKRCLTLPVNRFFFTESFFSLFNAFHEKFSKGESMGEVLKFVTTNGGLRKKRIKYLRFLQK